MNLDQDKLTETLAKLRMPLDSAAFEVDFETFKKSLSSEFYREDAVSFLRHLRLFTHSLKSDGGVYSFESLAAYFTYKNFREMLAKFFDGDAYSDLCELSWLGFCDRELTSEFNNQTYLPPELSLFKNLKRL